MLYVVHSSLYEQYCSVGLSVTIGILQFATLILNINITDTLTSVMEIDIHILYFSTEDKRTIKLNGVSYVPTYHLQSYIYNLV